MEIDCEAVDSIQVCRNECRREIFEAMGMLVPLRTVADFQRVCFDSEGARHWKEGPPLLDDGRTSQSKTVSTVYITLCRLASC